jgi:hypothetical protein
MKRLLSIVVLATAIAFAVVGFSKPTTVYANHGWQILSVTCSSGTISMLIYEDASTGTSVLPNIAINGVYLKTLPDLDLLNVNNGNHTYTDSDAAYVDGATVAVSNGNGSAVGGPSTASASCGSSNVITWFNPGDGRIDGRPGDRIAVWCNTTATPPNIVVYGVGDNATNGSHGFWLGTFNNADLLKAGKAGLTKNAGAGNGTISAMQDGHGNFYVAWNGGIFKATGQGDFAKSFSCTFSK